MKRIDWKSRELRIETNFVEIQKYDLSYVNNGLELSLLINIFSQFYFSFQKQKFWQWIGKAKWDHLVGFCFQDISSCGWEGRIYKFHFLNDPSSTYPILTCGTISELLPFFNADREHLEILE